MGNPKSKWTFFDEMLYLSERELDRCRRAMDRYLKPIKNRGGMLIIASTPLSGPNPLYEMYKENAMSEVVSKDNCLKCGGFVHFKEVHEGLAVAVCDNKEHGELTMIMKAPYECTTVGKTPDE